MRKLILTLTAMLGVAAQAAASLLMLATPAHATDDQWVENLATINSTFYPRVLDQYKDYARIKWRTADTEFTACNASISDSEGNPVEPHDYDYQCDSGSGNYLWWQGTVWDGTWDGKLAPRGAYTITVRYYGSSDQVIHEFSRRFTVATGTRWFKERYSVRGSEFDVKRTAGHCRVYRLSGDAELDCWGGRYAKVGYDFYVNYELGIKDFKWWASGTRGCCDGGTITRTGVRNRHDLDIDVKVTNWRSYSVDGVGFSWMAKNRI